MVNKKTISIVVISSLLAISSSFTLTTKNNPQEISVKSTLVVNPFPSTWGDSWTENKDDPFYNPTKQDYLDLLFAASERIRASRVSAGSGQSLSWTEDPTYSLWPTINSRTNIDIEMVYSNIFRIFRANTNQPFSETNYVDTLPEPLWDGQDYCIEFLINELSAMIPRFINPDIDILSYLNSNQDSMEWQDIPMSYMEWRLDWYNFDRRILSNIVCNPPSQCYTPPYYEPKKLYESLGYNYGFYTQTGNTIESPDGKEFKNERIFSDIVTSETNDVEMFRITKLSNPPQYYYQRYYSNLYYRSTDWFLSPPSGIHKYESFEIILDSTNTNSVVSFSIPLLCLDKTSIKRIAPLFTPTYDSPPYLIANNLIDIYSPVIINASGTSGWKCPDRYFPISLLTNGTVFGLTNGATLIGKFNKSESIGFQRQSRITGVNTNGEISVEYSFASDRINWSFSSNGYFTDTSQFYSSFDKPRANKWKIMQSIKESLTKLNFVYAESYLLADKLWVVTTNEPDFFIYDPPTEFPGNSGPIIYDNIIAKIFRDKTIYLRPHSYEHGSAWEISGLKADLSGKPFDIREKVKKLHLFITDIYKVEDLIGSTTSSVNPIFYLSPENKLPKEAAITSSSYKYIPIESFYSWSNKSIRTDSSFSIDSKNWALNNFEGPYQWQTNYTLPFGEYFNWQGETWGGVSHCLILEFDYTLD